MLTFVDDAYAILEHLQCHALFEHLHNDENRMQCYLQFSVILTTAMFTLVGKIADHSRENL